MDTELFSGRILALVKGLSAKDALAGTKWMGCTIFQVGACSTHSVTFVLVIITSDGDAHDSCVTHAHECVFVMLRCRVLKLCSCVVCGIYYQTLRCCKAAVHTELVHHDWVDMLVTNHKASHCPQAACLYT